MPRFHSTHRKNPEMKNLLRAAGVDPDRFALAEIRGKPARTKHEFRFKGNKLTLFCSDCVVIGYVL